MNLLLLPGDGIGPEVVSAANRVLDTLDISYEARTCPIGGAALDAQGVPVAEATLEAAKKADAVMLGAVGGPAWDEVERHLRPERGLLKLRQAMGVFANLRPARCFPGLEGDSPLRPELTAGVDMIVVRELIGGIYFGEPRTLTDEAGSDTMVYTTPEIERIGRVAFELAQTRARRLISVDKANVLSSSAHWRRVMTRLGRDYPDVELSHMYVDAAAMKLCTDPGSLDVVVTGNLFGDILSDEAAALTGSLGMLPSAAVGNGCALFEPVHGSAPDIAGQGIANPCATILSLAMMLRHLGHADAAVAVEKAVDAALIEGIRTPDLGGDATTDVVTEAICAHVGAVV